MLLIPEKEKVKTSSKGVTAGLFYGCFSVSTDDTQPKKPGLLKEIKRS